MVFVKNSKRTLIIALEYTKNSKETAKWILSFPFHIIKRNCTETGIRYLRHITEK